MREVLSLLVFYAYLSFLMEYEIIYICLILCLAMQDIHICSM